MSYFKHHVFFCTNQRADGSACCQDFAAKAARDYLKHRCKEEGIHGAGEVRVNTSGCLDRCEHGPVVVIYPQGTWYTYVDQEDLDAIFETHLLQGRIVNRLVIRGR